MSNEEVEPSVLERIVTPGTSQSLTSFSWHSKDENRFLAIVASGAIMDYTVFDRITLNWAPNSNIAWTYGRKTMKYVGENASIHSELKDISYKIKQRALTNYGLKVI